MQCWCFGQAVFQVDQGWPFSRISDYWWAVERKESDESDHMQIGGIDLDIR